MRSVSQVNTQFQNLAKGIPSSGRVAQRVSTGSTELILPKKKQALKQHPRAANDLRPGVFPGQRSDGYTTLYLCFLPGCRNHCQRCLLLIPWKLCYLVSLGLISVSLWVASISSKNRCQPLDEGNWTSWNWEDKQQRHASPLSVPWAPSFHHQHLHPMEETHYIMEASMIHVLAPTRLYYHKTARPKGYLHNKGSGCFKISPYSPNIRWTSHIQRGTLCNPESQKHPAPALM